MQQAVALLAVYFLMGMLLRCCWRGLSPALPGAAFVAHSSRSCSCQLSNNIDKKVDAPRRGCTYGPEAYADCHEDCRFSVIKINNLFAECNRIDVSSAVNYTNSTTSCLPRASATGFPQRPGSCQVFLDNYSCAEYELHEKKFYSPTCSSLSKSGRYPAISSSCMMVVILFPASLLDAPQWKSFSLSVPKSR